MRWLVLPVLLILFCTSVYAQPQVRLGGSLEETELGEIADIAEDKYDIDLKGLIGEIINGNTDFDIGEGLISVFFNELESNASFIKGILLICILNGLVATAMEGFADRDVVQTAYFAAFAAVAGMLVSALKSSAVSAAPSVSTSAHNLYPETSIPVSYTHLICKDGYSAPYQ